MLGVDTGALSVSDSESDPLSAKLRCGPHVRLSRAASEREVEAHAAAPTFRQGRLSQVATVGVKSKG
jgi:hypothetical protein